MQIFKSPYHAAVIFCIASFWQGSLQANEFVYAKDADGNKSSLIQKIVTTSRQNLIFAEPKDGALSKDRVSAYNIYYQLQADPSGAEEKNGFYRIAEGEDGKEVGWIKKDDTQVWATRYVIKPLVIDQKNVFKVTEGDTGDEFAYDSEQAGSQLTSYCFILDAPSSGDEDNGPFDVCFCMQTIASDAELSATQKIADMHLEIVFVVEDMRYLRNDYGGSTSVITALHQLGDKLAEKFGNENVPVKFGLVVATDSHPAIYVRKPTKKHPLTDDLNAWTQSFSTINGQVENGGSDYPNDGLSGIDLAINQMNWRSNGNSSKHIVYIGYAPFQKYGKFVGKNNSSIGPPEGPPLPGHYMTFEFCRNLINEPAWRKTYLDDDGSPSRYASKSGASANIEVDFWDVIFGTNQSGKWIDQIIAEAYPEGGAEGAEELRKKNIHAVHIGQTREDIYTPERIKELEALDAKWHEILKDFSPMQLSDFWDQQYERTGSYGLMGAARSLWMFKAWPFYNEAAMKQFGQLAKNRKYQGYLGRLDANKGSTEVKRVRNELGNRILEAINAIKEVGTSSGVGLGEAKGEIAKPIFKLIKMNSANTTARDKNQAVRVGTASLKATTKRTVGEKRVMVGYDELRKLETVFVNLHQKFKGMDDDEKNDSNAVLQQLKKELAGLTTGQTIQNDTQLQDIITDLPLKTEAIKISADDISGMNNRDFDVWIEDLDLAAGQISKLIKDPPNRAGGRWTTLNSSGQQKRFFSFLALHQLP